MLTLKLVHVVAVTLSLTGFVLRGATMLVGSPWLERRVVRVLPHVVDTVLLVSGVALALAVPFNPLHQPWLAAKLLALPLYVVLGALALRRARRYRHRVLSLLLALLVAAYMVGAAHRHSAWSWLA